MEVIRNVRKQKAIRIANLHHILGVRLTRITASE